MNDIRTQCFLAVAETLNFTKAAKSLFVSQSVLSRHISAMEKDLGVTLFIRDSKNVSLTPTGESLYDGLSDLRTRYASMLDKALALEQGFSGEIRIGSLPGQMVHAFVPYLKSFENEYSDIRIYIEAHSLREQRRRLASCQLDFSFGAGADFDYFQNLELEPIAKTNVCIVVHRGHRFYSKHKKSLGLKDFSEDVFITVSENELPVPARKMTEICKNAGFIPKQIIAEDLGTLMLWLETERGISILDETHVFASNPLMKFIPLSELGYTELSVIWNKENQNPCCNTFIEHVRDYKTKFRY